MITSICVVVVRGVGAESDTLTDKANEAFVSLSMSHATEIWPVEFEIEKHDESRE